MNCPCAETRTLTSASGYKQTSSRPKLRSAYPPTADIRAPTISLTLAWEYGWNEPRPIREVTAHMMDHEIFAKVLMRICVRSCKKKVQKAQSADPRTVIVTICAV